MQVAPNPPPLLLAGRDQLLARGLERVGEPGGVEGDPDLPREVAQQPLIARRERLARAPCRRVQRAERRAAVDQGDGQPLRQGRSGSVGDHARRRALVRLDRDVGELERRRDRRRDRGDDGVGHLVLLVVEVLAHRAEDRVGIVGPVADQAIEAHPQPGVQGPDGDGGEEEPQRGEPPGREGARAGDAAERHDEGGDGGHVEG